MQLSIEEICEILKSQDRRAKIAFLEAIEQQCLCASGPSESDILQLFNECYLHILKCYSDRFESVRDRAAQTINAFLQRLPANEFLLANVVATLVDRLGQHETVEESEEIRLIFVKQLLNLEKLFIMSKEDALHACYGDIVRILIKTLTDPYPAVQRESCACVTLLAESANSLLFKSLAEQLSTVLYRLLNHKHSQTRIAAIKALGFLALHIDSNENALSRLLMEVSPLLMDSVPLVRRECGALGARLMLELRDRYSYFDKLIPLVLCCLKDDSSEVQAYILPLWQKCGKQYYDENEAELSKQEIADSIPANYPLNVIRPTVGCRGIVQRCLRLLKLIMGESRDWKENVRLHSIKLLYQFVLHAETTMTAKFFEIYPDVARAAQDSEPAVMQEAFKVCDLMGRLLNYEDWYEHGFGGLESNPKEGYLKCFYYMYNSSLGVIFEHNFRLSKLLVQPEFSQTLKFNFQLYVLKLIRTILSKIKCMDESQVKESENFELYKNLYCSTVKVMALSLDSNESNTEELQTKSLNILMDIAYSSNCSIDDLHDKYFTHALVFVQNIDAPLDALSEPILLLYGLIKLVKFRAPCIKQLQQKINTVVECCADESKVKIFSAISIALLDWNKTIRRSVKESCNLLNEFINLVIESHLIWKAGATAEALRSIAVASLCSISQGAAEEAQVVLPKYSKYMPQLLEDQAVSTRHYAIKCLFHFGEIDIRYLKTIAYACLQRLDDPAFGIRILAAAVLPKLQPTFTNQEVEYNIWLTFIKNCFDLLLLHYDTPEIRLQEAIKDTLIELGKRYPEILKDSYQRNLAATHNCFNLKELISELNLID